MTRDTAKIRSLNEKLAALRSKLQAITDPENQPNQYGVQVLPVDPTEEMESAFFDVGAAGWKAAYRNMLAHAPKDLLKDG